MIQKNPQTWLSGCFIIQLSSHYWICGPDWFYLGVRGFFTNCYYALYLGKCYGCCGRMISEIGWDFFKSQNQCFPRLLFSYFWWWALAGKMFGKLEVTEEENTSSHQVMNYILIGFLLLLALWKVTSILSWLWQVVSYIHLLPSGSMEKGSEKQTMISRIFNNAAILVVS